MFFKGWVSNWDNSKANVWLTAWVIRQFQHVSFQDWEDYIYIDPTVMGSAVMWLINYQTADGSFSETEYYPNPLHKPMEGKSRFREDYRGCPHDIPYDKCNLDGYGPMRNISLTAHVLISLEITAPNVQGELKKYSARARQRATSYLERNMNKIEVCFIRVITHITYDFKIH